MNSRAFHSATDLINAIRHKHISALELLESYIERIEHLNPAINAIVATNFEDARKRAAKADQALAKGETWGALHGLPMTIKDNLEVVGMPCTAGAPALKNHMPEQNADLVQSLLDQGAIIFGKTNMPRYGEDIQSYNEVYGQTNNPWDFSLTPGGSSGGAAAAVAAGLTGLEIGNDIAGSIRHPANFCGIYGHKPSFGIVPDKGMIPPPPGVFPGDQTFPSDILVSGPLARNAQDLDLALGIIVSPERPEKTAWQIHLPEPRKKRLCDYRIGLWLNDPACPVDSQVGNALQNAADALAKSGAQIVDQRPDIDFNSAMDIFFDLLNGVMGLGVPPKMFEEWICEAQNPGDTKKDPMARFKRGAIQRHRSWLMQDAQRQILRHKWADFFKDHDAVLCPATCVPAFAHDHQPFHGRTITVNGKPRPYADLMGWAGLTNMVYLPATIAPVGMTLSGLPVGIQIVGPYLEDRTPIHIAGLMADVVGGYHPPEKFV
ncbi:MAG: amidase [Proteobacteria bacterium]|nr:amidase [Pseudomonadota bacterium]MBU1387322.1 amidase [Pseudomonadota bacterium]MBU1544304.1 amidase [Pseudomonadota bacterium]MBU2480255.1 amidase [Pseudomonadota bacterium]